MRMQETCPCAGVGVLIRLGMDQLTFDQRRGPSGNAQLPKIRVCKLQYGQVLLQLHLAVEPRLELAPRVIR